MKTTFKLAIGTALLIAQFTACKKPDIPVEVTTCKIANFTYSQSGSPSTTSSGVVKYNSAGNPLSVVVAQVSTGNPHALFMYDKYNRLTDFIGSYGNVTDPANLPAQAIYEYWVRYAYADENPASLPVRDTARGLVQYTNGAITYASQTIIETITYDAQNRIIKIDAPLALPPTRTYTYDANGNLVLPNVTYDDKKNFRGGNKVWMLIDRNYSKNNPFIATQYNSDGYPTFFPPAPANFGALDNFLRRSMNFKSMDYTCSSGTMNAQ